MPAPKKPVERTEREVQLEAQLEEMRALLEAQTAPTPQSRQDELLERLVALQEAQKPKEREAGLMEMGSAVLTESEHLTPLDPPEHPLDHEVVFFSKGKNLTIVKTPRRAMQDGEGNQWLRAGQHISFAPQGEFRTNDPEIVEWLHGRSSYGREFWASDDVPGGIQDPAVALERIMQYATDLNEPGLNEMEAEERSGPNRKIVMDAIKTAQRQVGVAKVKYPPAQVS